MQESAEDVSGLLGAWKLISAPVRMEDTGEVTEPLGPNPRGFAIFAPNGRMMVVLTAGGRAPPTSDAESAALFNAMTAYTGRFEVHQNQVLFKIDAAWQPAWENTELLRFFELEGDRLTLRTAVQEHPAAPGRKFRAVLTWVRDQ